MDVEKIKFTDGREIPISTLPGLVSADLYQTAEHYEVCEALAEAHGLREEARLVLENLLALKSHRAKTITALLWTLDKQRSEIASISAFGDICDVVSSLRGSQFALTHLGPTRTALISWRHAVLLLAKAIQHRMFRLLASRPTRGRRVLRSWVEVSEAMYPEDMARSSLRIFPFALGVVRQLGFVRSCMRHGRRWSLDGLPYSLWDALRAIVTDAGREAAMAVLEADAYERYASECLGWGVDEVLTSDEYEIGAVVLYRRLIAAGFRVVNTAHGIGWYCPHVAYTEFRAFNQAQGDFYRQRCPKLNVTIRPPCNVRLPFDHASCVQADKVAFVVVHQNFDDYQLPAERAAQVKLARAVSRAADSCGAECFVKLHPNLVGRQGARSVEGWGGKPMFRWDGLCGYRPVFVVINSTAYFELREVAPVLVYAGESFLPELYFGEGFLTITDHDAIGKLTRYVDLRHWQAEYARQAGSSRQGNAA